jgi:hypothetical protein
VLSPSSSRQRRGVGTTASPRLRSPVGRRPDRCFWCNRATGCGSSPCRVSWQRADIRIAGIHLCSFGRRRAAGSHQHGQCRRRRRHCCSGACCAGRSWLIARDSSSLLALLSRRLGVSSEMLVARGKQERHYVSGALLGLLRSGSARPAAPSRSKRKQGEARSLTEEWQGAPACPACSCSARHRP